MRIDEVKQESVGKWPGIMQALGIDVGDGRHGPCVLCGGVDRFRFDDKDGRGTWICGQCGCGDGFKLVELKLGIDFKAAIAEVGRLLGSVESSPVLPEKKVSPEILRKVFIESAPITGQDFVSKYLENRGLKTFPNTLRFANKCYEMETKRDMPAMLAVVTSHAGKAISIHRTYLTLDGYKQELQSVKKMMPCLETVNGAAIRLFDPINGTIGLAEGIETAIACFEMFGIPTWAAISANGMETFVPPAGIKEVCIFGDYDKNFRGHKAAYVLANKLIEQKHISATVMMPEKIGHDWLDQHVEIKKRLNAL